MTVDAGSFRQLPDAPAANAPRSRRATRSLRHLVGFVVTALIAGAAPLLITDAISDGTRSRWVALAALVEAAALTAATRVAPRSWWTTGVLALTAGLAMAAPGGRVVGLVGVVAGVTAGWVGAGSDLPGGRRIDRGAVPALVGAAIAAAFATRTISPEWLKATPLVTAVPLGLAAAAATRPAPFVAVDGAVRRLASAVAAAVGAALTVVVGLVVVVLPWLAQRAVRWDPTWVPRATGTRWVPVVRSSTDAVDLWGPDPRATRSTAGRRWHRLGAVAAAMILLAGAFATKLTLDGRREERAKYGVAALADSPWWPAMSDAIDISYGRSTITSFVGVRLADARFPDFNITDERRHTWRPPTDDCPAARVWMFGGSTAFGLGQRDDHTIASELARAAWADGVALEVDNWGVPADTAWMEGRRLELALAEGAAAPDIAVFYDGANDYRVQAQLNAMERGGEQLFASDLDPEVLTSLTDDFRRKSALREVVRPGPEMDPPTTRRLSDAGVGSYAAIGYAATDRFLRPVLDANGIDSFRFYQPTLVSRDRPVAGEPPPSEIDDTIEAAFRADLPAGVIDLAGAMDGERRPVYYDALHTNELGARVVARAMWEHLAPTLDAEVTPCD